MLLYEDHVRPAVHVRQYERMMFYEKIQAYNDAVEHCGRFKWPLPQPQSFGLSTLDLHIFTESGLVEPIDAPR